MRKFGADFKGEGNIAFLKPKYTKNTWDFKVGQIKTELKALYTSGISNASLDGLECSKCGSIDQIEMHHVRKLSDLDPKLSEMDRLMIKIKRKQIPLCRTCHMEQHRLSTKARNRDVGIKRRKSNRKK